VLVASIDVRGASTVTPPIGWAPVEENGPGYTAGPDLTKATFWHLVGPSEPGSYAWTFSSAAAASGVLVAYAGVDNAAPVEASTQANASGSSVSTPPAPTTAGSMLLGFFGIATNATFTPPSGMTERGDVAVTSGSVKVASEATDRLLSAAEPSARTATATKAAISIGQLVVLRPAP
jgi:hypothetical protein